jgi:3-oxoacyl-[acyl-carrier protein] reductase
VRFARERLGSLSQFSGRVALVTSGSRGIGAAVVRTLAASGWHITFCHDRDDQAAVEAEKAALELGARVLAVQADVTREAEVISWVRRAEEELGPVQAAVSCAGITRDLPLTRLADADWRALTDTGLDGAFHLCRAVLPAMMKRESGRIVTVSSVSAVHADDPASRSIPARAGIAGFTRALAGQTRRYGIRANAIIPAAASGRADMTALWPAPAPLGGTPLAAEIALAEVPLPRAPLAEARAPEGRLTEAIAVRRFASAEAVADRVAYLLSDAAPEITGTILEIPWGI